MQFKCSGTKAIVKEFQIITVPIVAVLAISAYVEAECLYYSYKDKNYSIIKQYSYNLQFTIAKKVPKPVYAKTPTLGTTVSVWTASFYKRINRLDSTASLCIVLKRQVRGNILIG